jgi:hypothetical protein
MQYDDHEIIKRLKASPHYDLSDDAWNSFKETFAVASPEWRLESLNGVDQWLSLEDRPTKDHARLLTMKRELSGIHSKMRSVGR